MRRLKYCQLCYNTTPYAYGENIRAVVSELQSLAFRLFIWFENKRMKANPGKSHVLLSDKKTEKMILTMLYLTQSVEKELFGIIYCRF